jgi:ABC-2 type transport system permease protein
MRRILAQARKELTQIVRDWRTLILALVLPLVLLMLMGNAISLTVNHLPIVVQDFDDSLASHEFADAFRARSRSLSFPDRHKQPEAFRLNKARCLIIPAHL